MKIKFESVYDDYFPEEAAEYFEAIANYYKMTDEDRDGAFELSKITFVLSDRYNTISNDATKLDSIKYGQKTDKQKFFYGRYRLLREMHTHARMVWNSAKEEARTYGNGTM